jgi:hypothetical protein
MDQEFCFEGDQSYQYKFEVGGIAELLEGCADNIDDDVKDMVDTLQSFF